MQLLQWVTDLFPGIKSDGKFLTVYTQDLSGYFENFSDLQTQRIHDTINQMNSCAFSMPVL